MVRYAILGPVELRVGERGVPVGGARQVALLALLLVHANQALSSDRLIDALWSQQHNPAGGLKSLHVTISRLRKALDIAGAGGESALRTVGGGYLLAVQPDELDAQVFQTRMQDGLRALQASDARRACDVLDEALRMWRGPALADVSYEEFAQVEIRRLEELRLVALQARVDAKLELGDHTAAVAELESLVAEHPVRERLVGQLMVALYRCGRQGEALDVYARARAYLASELGLEPGPTLKTLQAQILGQSPALEQTPGEPGAAAGDVAVAAQAGALPTGVVTFVLTDIEGSTRLWEADIEAMESALELHDGLIARLVEQHGGWLLKDKGEGDATMSVFARASDAVACAAELQRDLATTSWPSRLDVRVRIAVHSGEAQKREGDYFGPVLNRAARLRSLATGGVTVLSQSTAELVRDRLPRELALVDIGRHELRGMSRPERVFELRTTPGATTAGSAVTREPIKLALPRSLHVITGSAFVGRDAELARLRDSWEQVRDGGWAAVVIGGEPGIGKTRLASEFANAVYAQDALVLYGRCDEGLAVPYQPFVEAVRPYARAVGLERLRSELGELAAELGLLLPEFARVGEPIRRDPESARFALFEAVADLTETMTRERSALLVLDDLHWAAPPTLLLLRHLIRCECRLSGMVLCTYRQTELASGQPLARLLADLHRDGSVEGLTILGLDESAITALVEAVGMSASQERAQFVETLATHTAGNPFFIRELIAHSAQPGRGSAPGVTLGRLEAPQGLRQVLRHRITRLSAHAGRVLTVAAVVGPTFSFVLLERVFGEGVDVIGALDEAVAAGLLTEAGHGDYAFAHALVRQTIYDDLSAARRMRLHREVGEALEALGNVQAHVEALAHHFGHATADGQADKAAAYALAAGRTAIARLGYEDAVAHYERGLEALTLSGQPQDQRRCELLLALGQASWGAGDLDNARRACTQAAELADKLGDATTLAYAALGVCGPHRFEATKTVTQPIVSLLEGALAALDHDDGALRAELMSRLAIYTDVQERKLPLARGALEMARKVADKVTLADVLASTLWATRGPDVIPESMALAAELGVVADDIGDRPLRALAHRWLLEHLLELADIDAAEREFQALQLLAATRKERHIKWVAAVFRATHAHLAGSISDCEALLQDALTHCYEGHDDDVAQGFGVQMLFVRREQGRLDEVLETVERFAKENPQLAGWRCALALIYAQLGDRAQARQEVEALAHANFCDIRRDAYWLSNLSGLSEVVFLLGDASRAQSLYKLLSPYAERCVVIFGFLCQGSVSHPLGLLATAMARYGDAARHFEHALTMNAQVRSPRLIAHTQHDYAHMLLQRNHPRDRAKALQLLKQALATAEQLGLKALAEKTRRLKLATEAAGPPSVRTRRA